MSLQWSKAFKITCWFCGKAVGVIVLQKDVTQNKSKLYGTHHVCQSCLDNSKKIHEKVLPIIVT